MGGSAEEQTGASNVVLVLCRVRTNNARDVRAVARALVERVIVWLRSVDGEVVADKVVAADNLIARTEGTTKRRMGPVDTCPVSV